MQTFIPYEIASEPHLLAAYTCTPLVKFPIGKLEPGTKVVGTTIAELGNRNRPLDMIAYEKDGEQSVLLANSSRGVMKISTETMATQEGITERTDITGVPYETIESLQGVMQLDKLDAERAVIIAQAESGEMSLRTIDLP